ncbi:hypothetical protein AC249_AIPGENE11964 [Exaiptasia diaphana]|nr:hypothetical protein AC249_AIPGENE11964 [Exaiptasia diaphana]
MNRKSSLDNEAEEIHEIPNDEDSESDDDEVPIIQLVLQELPGSVSQQHASDLLHSMAASKDILFWTPRGELLRNQRRYCKKPLDMAFLIDTSVSTVGALNLSKNFIAKVSEKFDQSQEYAKIGIVEYNTNAVSTFTFNNFTSSIKFQRFLDSVALGHVLHVWGGCSLNKLWLLIQVLTEWMDSKIMYEI